MLRIFNDRYFSNQSEISSSPKKCWVKKFFIWIFPWINFRLQWFFSCQFSQLISRLHRRIGFPLSPANKPAITPSRNTTKRWSTKPTRKSARNWRVSKYDSTKNSAVVFFCPSFGVILWRALGDDTDVNLVSVLLTVCLFTFGHWLYLNRMHRSWWRPRANASIPPPSLSSTRKPSFSAMKPRLVRTMISFTMPAFPTSRVSRRLDALPWPNSCHRRSHWWATNLLVIKNAPIMFRISFDRSVDWLIDWVVTWIIALLLILWARCLCYCLVWSIGWSIDWLIGWLLSLA